VAVLGWLCWDRAPVSTYGAMVAAGGTVTLLASNCAPAASVSVVLPTENCNHIGTNPPDIQDL